MIDRLWELLPHALQAIIEARGLSEQEALEQLKAYIVDERVRARGPWRRGIDGQPRLNGDRHELPAASFGYAELTRDGAGVFFSDRCIEIPWVEINMDELRAALFQSVGHQESAEIRTGLKPGQKAKEREVYAEAQKMLASGRFTKRYGATAQIAREIADSALGQGYEQNTIEKHVRPAVREYFEAKS